MKIPIPKYLASYEDQLSDRLKVTVSFLAKLHRRYKGIDIFMFYFYDAKVLMDVGLCSVHPPKSQGPILCGNYGHERFALGLINAKKQKMSETIEWEIEDETCIALHTYFNTLYYGDFDFEGDTYKIINGRQRRFTSTQMKEMFNLIATK